MAVWSLAVVLLLAAGRPPLQAQDQTPPGTSYRIDTVAGGGVGDGGPAVEAHFYVGNDGWLSVATDAAGNVYVAGGESNRVRRIDTAGVISTFAGTGEEGFSGEGGPAVQAQLSYPAPAGVAVDATGNVYVADVGNHRVRRVDTAGVITTFAGTGEDGFSGDGGPAVQAQLSYPAGVAVDGAGNVYVAGYESSRVRRIDTAGVISTFAGTGEDGFSGDGGPATEIPIAEIVRGGPRSPDTTPQAWHHFSDARPS